jgi:hypothetical protein
VSGEAGRFGVPAPIIPSSDGAGFRRRLRFRRLGIDSIVIEM